MTLYVNHFPGQRAVPSRDRQGAVSYSRTIRQFSLPPQHPQVLIFIFPQRLRASAVIHI